MLERDEGTQLAATNNIVNQDWDAAWDSEEDARVNDDEINTRAGRNRHSMEEERRNTEVVTTPIAIDEDAADAWGWGDEDDEGDSPAVDNTTATFTSAKSRLPSGLETPDVRQVTMTERYWTSSMPQPVLRTLTQIFEDGARLIQPEYVVSN